MRIISWLKCTLIALLLMATTMSIAQDSSDVAWVVFEGNELIEIYATSEGIDLEERASIISERLKRIKGAGKLEPDSFHVSMRDSVFYVMYGGSKVLTVRSLDAEGHQLSAEATADLYVSQFKQKLTSQNAFDFFKSLVLEIFLALLVILLLFVVIRYMNRLFRWLNQRLIRSNSEYLTGLKIRNYELLSKERVTKALSMVLTGLKWLVILITVYISLPILFSIFPGTEGIARSLFGLVLDPVKGLFQSLIGFLPNMITIAVIYFAVRYAVRALRFMATEVRDGKLVLTGFYPDWAMPTYQILRFIFYAFGFVMVFPYLPGSDSPVFQGVSVFLGLLVSFGSGSAISNAVAGIVITYMRPFKRGDRVKIGEVTGDVIEKTLLVTRIRTIKNEEITVPNSAILNGHTINYTTGAQEKGLILYTTVTIGYDVPWKKVHQLLINAALDSEGIEKDPQPFVLQTSLDDFYVSYQLNCYTRNPAKAAVWYSNIHTNIQDAFNEAGVEILSPHYRAARDGNQVTIPPHYLPPDYVAPRFGVDLGNDRKTS